eukprot:gene19311-25173_t
MDTEEEKEQENINNISNDNIISSSLDIINKPIKKKERDDVEDEDFQSPSELSQPDSSHVNNDIVEMELKARSELEHFLTNKGIDATYANDFKIHVRRNKNKKSRESGSFTYSVTYSTAEGNLLTSKSEVVDSIKLNIKKTSRYSNVSGTEDMRQSSYEDALIATSKKLNSLPLQCHNIKIYNLGTVDLRPSFHNSVQIYPVGYKCEQSITSGSTSRGSSREQVVTCEIMDVEGDPEFIITVNATGQTYLAPSESLVWKKDQSVTAKNTYLAKLDREKRTVERQKQKFDDKKDDTKESRPKRLSSDKSNQEVDKDEILKLIPTQEQLESNNEEWFCPLCVYEDSTLLKPLEPRDDTKSKHYVDEWGPSALIPWLLNKNHSNIIDDININSPHLILIVNALEVIINNGESMHWNTDQRTVVLLALFKVLQSNSKANEYLQSIHSNCEKLMKVSSKSTFREADFMKTVKLLCGEEGVAICRSYLDGISDNSELYQRIIEGRCIICKGTTFESDGNDENDENGEEKEDEIILCDGCDAEAHLRCLNLNEVPNRDWHCPSCAERIAKRESKQDCYVGNIEDHKRKDLEEDLIEKAINAKASGTAKTLDDAMNEMVCRYCGLSELDICSPLVIGQSREEHETHISSSRPAIANDVLPNLPNTSIKFSIDGVIQEPPAIAIPYLPLVNSPDGVKLVNLSQSLGCQPCIVHEHCALQMFQARLDRSRHTIRRRRKVIGDKAVSMAGISIKSLGRDNNYREYWKFPVSDDLFVTYDGPVDAEKKEFDRLIETSNDAIKSDESNAVEDPTNQPDNANNQSTANDNVPVALKLLKDKGVDVLSNYVIDEEDVFDDTNDTENVAEVDDISHVEYFSYSKKFVTF